MLFLWRNEGNWPIEYVSDNVAVFGYDPQVLMAEPRPYGSLIHPDDAGPVHRAMRAFMAEGPNEYGLHYRLLAADGSERWVDEHGLILRDAGSRADRVQGVVIDVTERHKAEEQLQVYRTRLEAMVRERTRGTPGGEPAFAQGYRAAP